MTPQFHCSSFADASYPHILVPSCWRVLRSRRIAQGWKYRMFVYFIVPKGVILIGNKPFSCWPKKLFVYVSVLTAWPVWPLLLFLSFSFTTAWLSYPTSTYIRLAVLFLQILSGRDQVGTFNDFFIKFQNYVFFMTLSTIHFYRNTMYFYGKQCRYIYRLRLHAYHGSKCRVFCVVDPVLPIYKWLSARTIVS